MDVRGTQSGQMNKIKKNAPGNRFGLAPLVIIAAGLSLASCAGSSGGWYQPVKNERLTKMDYAACQARAEETTLELSRSDRPGYGVLDGNRPGPFNPRDDDPMALVDRSGTAKVYEALVASCMVEKGYQQPDDQ